MAYVRHFVVTAAGERLALTAWARKHGICDRTITARWNKYFTKYEQLSEQVAMATLRPRIKVTTILMDELCVEIKASQKPRIEAGAISQSMLDILMDRAKHAARKYCIGSDNADARSSALLFCLERLHKYDPSKCEFGAWAYSTSRFGIFKFLSAQYSEKSFWKKRRSGTVSLDSPDTEMTVTRKAMEAFEDSQALVDSHRRLMEIMASVKKLDSREVFILQYVLEGLNWREIGDRLKISDERVRQLIQGIAAKVQGGQHDRV